MVVAVCKWILLSFLLSFSCSLYAKQTLSLSYAEKAKQLLLNTASMSQGASEQEQDIFANNLGASQPPNATTQWSNLRKQLKNLSRVEVTEGFKLELDSFKSSPLAAEQRQILKQDPRFAPRLSEGLDTSTGYGVSFKIDFE